MSFLLEKIYFANENVPPQAILRIGEEKTTISIPIEALSDFSCFRAAILRRLGVWVIENPNIPFNEVVNRAWGKSAMILN
jgi:hypothetical protein